MPEAPVIHIVTDFIILAKVLKLGMLISKIVEIASIESTMRVGKHASVVAPVALNLFL